MKRLHSIPFLALAAALAVVGCATGRNVQAGAVASTDRSNAIQVNVQNDNTYAMDIYVLGGGQVWRLGHVSGTGSASLTIPPGIVASAGQLRLLADPLGSFGAYLSDPIMVTTGDTIQFSIAASLPLSNVSVY